MPRKQLKVQVELDVQAVTCPGVWLCPSGKISLQLCMLDSCIQTTGLLPNFPLLYHEKYIFYKMFDSARSLGDLQKSLNKEQLYAELIQWQNCDIGNVIASFQTSLGDVLYPSAYEGAIAGVDVDLLMEPSKHFPGIISPKIEISTRTTVEETVCTDNDHTQCSSFVINPKTVTSENRSSSITRKNQPHQQKVCHSLGYHKTRRCIKTRRISNKPPFIFKKVDEALIMRKPSGVEQNVNRCSYCSQPQLCQRQSSQLSQRQLSQRQPSQMSQRQHPQRKLSYSPPRTYSKMADDLLHDFSKSRIKSGHKPPPGKPPKRGSQMCSCGSGHTEEHCPVCSKYHYYFESDACSCTAAKSVGGASARFSRYQ